VVNGRANAGRLQKREGLSPLIKISHAEMMGSDHDLGQNCPPFISNRLELWIVVETDNQMGTMGFQR
jgi:hypothetical protein